MTLNASERLDKTSPLVLEELGAGHTATALVYDQPPTASTRINGDQTSAFPKRQSRKCSHRNEGTRKLFPPPLLSHIAAAAAIN